MTHASISESSARYSATALTTTRLLVLLLVATFTAVIPARAQSSDTWKSVAIIGGSTAAGAYVGHKVAGTTGAYVGAAVGASTGYAIDRRRRQNEYYNNDYASANNGYYGNNGGYYGNNGPYSGNDPYYGQYPSSSPYPLPYQNNRYFADNDRR